MARNNTGNPIPSSSLRDLFDNSQAFDELMNSTEESALDRFGRERVTWQAFHNLTTNALAQIGVIVQNASDEIQESVDGVAQEAAAAAAAIALLLGDLSDDLGNKGFDLKSQMLAYTPKYDGTLAWVQNDPVAENNGFYQWRQGTNTWVKPSIQPVLSDAFTAFKKSISVKKRFRTRNNVNDRLIMAVDQLAVLFGNQRKVFRTAGEAEGTTVMVGDTPLVPAVARKRFRTQQYPGPETLVMVGRTVVLSSANGSSSIVATSPDAKLVQEQNQAPVSRLSAAVVSGQVVSYAPERAPSQLTSSGSWLAANANAFNIVRAVGGVAGSPKQYSITQFGWLLQEAITLMHKLATGQSLTLGSRGLVPNSAGEYVIETRRGDLVSPYTPIGYTDSLFNLAGGPRPTNSTTTSIEPTREYVSGVVAETPATSYLLSFKKWHQRNTAIDPKLLYSISAQGGAAYALIKKGTAVYTALMAQIDSGKAIAAANAWAYVIPSFSIVHGESQINTTQAEYVAILAEWANDLATDALAKNPQSWRPRSLISQMLTGEAGTIPGIPLAQLQAANTNDDIVLIGPKYAYPYWDQYHMQAEGYVKMGEIEARAERLTMLVGKWQPLKVIGATVSGSTITLRLNNLPNGNAATSGPIGRLALDTALVSDPGSFGFLISAGGIVNVQLGSDGASLILTTSVPVAAGTVLTYALQPTLGSPQTNNGRRGCVRDNDHRDYSRFDNKPLYNWLCAFSQALEV